MRFPRHITTVTICNIDNFTIQNNILQIGQKPSPIPQNRQIAPFIGQELSIFMKFLQSYVSRMNVLNVLFTQGVKILNRKSIYLRQF
jgi:hypothetical protein